MDGVVSRERINFGDAETLREFVSYLSWRIARLESWTAAKFEADGPPWVSFEDWKHDYAEDRP